ncbi:TlpA family protein disulfide reductase [Aquimarina sp. 2201CG14-23]|uniref:TlpA family protein disulfide reductase n=1 Tax=Aquimarina mycalae TaxID=3040073 RepID=UPI0024782B3A|nr:TlpA disulfide reductase family protein [Aquimarina sp. 2201CG14-23]MDH7447158.1 TlpA disulfide reductase family protein [Aquimarina sp. 2201CG14-23]
MTKALFFLIFLACSYNIIAQENNIPDVTVFNVNGEEINILDQIDKLTIIDFWATWCKPCIAQMPDLEKIKASYKGKVEVISISIDHNYDQWVSFVSKRKTNDHHYLIGKNNPLIKFITVSWQDEGFAGSSTSIPVIILVDKNGKIINKNCPHPASGSFKELVKQNI